MAEGYASIDPDTGAPRQRDPSDASFHSPAWQAHYLQSLTATRPTYEEFQRREKEREGKLAAAAEKTDEETRAFRAQLEADREKRLARVRGGGVAKKKKRGGGRKDAKKSKGSKKGSKKAKEKKHGKKSGKKKRKRDSDSDDDSDSDSGSSGSDDPTEKFRLSGFFNKAEDGAAE